MPDKIYISWEEFHRHTKELAAAVKAKGSFNKIVAISRGGLLPAGILAYELDIRNSQAINISSYDGDHARSDGEIEISASAGAVDEHTLIVDDLSDTGRTFKLLRPLFPQACYVTVYAKPQGAEVVDIYAADIPNQWIVFPWD